MKKSHPSIKEAPRIRLEPNVKKIVAAICFILAEAKKLGQKPTQYEIVKTLFIADKKHLNDYGRPVTFDNYAAMLHGPVPSLAYDLLKGNETAIRKYGKALPWRKIKRETESSYCYSLISIDTSFDELSDSDKEALSGALVAIKSLTFGQIRQLTHNDPAYIQAWSEEGEHRSYPMDLTLMFEKPNPEAAQALAFLSRHQ